MVTATHKHMGTTNIKGDRQGITRDDVPSRHSLNCLVGMAVHST